MQRPQIRVIDHQKEETKQDVQVSQSESDYLLAKYGYKQQTNTVLNTNPQTFEEMVAQKENEKRRIEEEKIKKINSPKPASFDSKNVNYYENKWVEVELDNNKLGLKIQIITDMKI